MFARPSEWARTATGQAEGKPTASRGQHYFAFLSYSHRDEAVAKWLHDELEKFRVPFYLVGKLTEHGPVPRRLTPIFRDLHELAASDDLGSEIREAIAGSRFLIVLCSPAAAQSRWTNAEIEAFKRARGEDCILAAIVAGEPFASDIPGREVEECLPPALRYHYDRRGKRTNKRAEPLAADLREDGEARRLGFLKIVAGMLGLGLDDLVQRETLRRQRRLATITGASFLGMLVATGLAVAAIQARDAARDQRREAEGLVAFMLGDLKEKLEPIGRLDALDGVGSRVLAYYSKQDTSDLTDAALLQRARALSLTAQVAYLRGNLDQAERLYRQALAGTAEATSRNPDDPQRLFDHAQNVFWIGDLARKRGDARGAEAAVHEYKRLADRMVALEPNNLKWRMEAAYGDVNLGIVHRNQRRFPEAARHFTRAVGLIQSVASIDSANAEYQRELANALGWLADAERDQGRLEAAIRIRERQIAFARQRIQSGATDVGLRTRVIPAHQGLGILLSWTRGPASGIDQLRLGIAEANRLIAIEPDNSYSKGVAAQVRLELAGTLLSLDQSAEANAEARTGCELTAQVLARDPGPNWRHLQTSCLTIRSRLALESGANAEALSLAQRALASARTERSADPITDRYRIASAYLLLGDVRKRVGEHEAAGLAWTAALAQLPRNVAERPLEMSEHAQLLRRLGRTEEARPLSARLAAIGYRSVT
jgi:tetratricopeptide (TPR) repeat protein